MQEKENVIYILKEALAAVKRDDGLELKHLSDRTNHIATISQDPDNIILAVLIYSLGKIIGRENYRRMKGWNFFIKTILKELENAIRFLKEDDIVSFRNCLGKMRNTINEVEGDLKNYINEVFQKAGINRAFKYYEHGLSSQKTADLLGISLWDLSSFIGQSNISEAKVSQTIPVKQRIKIMEDFFK